MINPMGGPTGGKKERDSDRIHVKKADPMAARKERPKVAFFTPAILAPSHMKKVAMSMARAATPRTAVDRTAIVLKKSILFLPVFQPQPL